MSSCGIQYRILAVLNAQGPLFIGWGAEWVTAVICTDTVQRVNLGRLDRQQCDRIFWKFYWKSFLFKSRVVRKTTQQLLPVNVSDVQGSNNIHRQKLSKIQNNRKKKVCKWPKREEQKSSRYQILLIHREKSIQEVGFVLRRLLAQEAGNHRLKNLQSLDFAKPKTGYPQIDIL
jgi:hypothetical protein